MRALISFWLLLPMLATAAINYPAATRIPISSGGGGGGTVTFDAVGPGSGGTNNQGSLGLTHMAWNHVCTGTHGAIFVEINSCDDTTVPTVTYNSVSLSLISTVHGNAGTTGKIMVFGLVNPATGTHVVDVSGLGNGPYSSGGSTSFAGVNQSTGWGTPVTSTGSSSTASATSTLSANNIVLASVCAGNALSAPNHTGRWLANGSTACSAGEGAAQTHNVSGSVTMSWTVASDDWGVIWLEVLHD